MALNIKCGPFSLQNDNEEMPYEAEVMDFQKSFEEIVKQDCKSSKDNLVMKILCFDIPWQFWGFPLFYSKEIMVSLHLTLKEMKN